MRDEREAQEPMAAGAAEWLIHVQSTADAASTSPGLFPYFNWLCAASSQGPAQGVASGYIG